MNWRKPTLILLLLLLAGLVITWLNIGRTNIDAIQIQLGAWEAPNAKARTVDDGVMQALERGHLNAELRLRLDKRERNVLIAPFQVDECEVSQRDYERFVDWTMTRSSNPDETAPEWLRSLSTGHRTAGRLNSPASGVSQRGATLYCQAIGGRLPMVEEMEAAARGSQGRLYPWGNEFDPGHWPYREPDRNAQQECGRHPAASTPNGVQDIANNVMEWTAGTMDPMLLPSPNQRPVVGAPPVRTSARELYALSAAWLPIDLEMQSHHLGFRCVYELPPPPVLPWGTPAGNTISVQGGSYTVGIPNQARVANFVTSLPPDSDVSLTRLLLSSENQKLRIRADRCEVSREDYSKFLNDPLVKVGLYGNDNEPAGHSYEPLDWTRQKERLELPVTGISWWSADAFARWSGGRLPSADEWRAIASGTEKRIFPWGDSYDPAAAATGDDAAGRLVPCDANVKDVTREGIRHLAGNVSEWTRSVSLDAGTVVMWAQGGNWMLPGEDTARTTFGRKVPLNHRTETIGFRVVYD
ncbi:MAG: SUMF1/EgtB/PvdO family nonheme iron enzyme [Gammaproteobacteria bacterium]|nr:SUMF1/EgtB/PvdO family nonheme iron enzyme [Gammaproteobacteria bacterium]